MVLILSDGGKLAADVTRQLELYNEEYIGFYTDFGAAGRCGNGNVVVGVPNEATVREVIRENRIDAVIDCMDGVSVDVQRVCNKLEICYVKYINIKERPGLKLCLYYNRIADMVKRADKVLFYASPITVRAVATACGKEHINKICVAVPKAVTFDTSAALEYSIPLLNVTETGSVDDSGEVAAMLKKTGAVILICDDTVSVDAKAEAAFNLGIPIILTHSKGFEFSNAVATARDAVILIHSASKK